jgi:hypothetical protein
MNTYIYTVFLKKKFVCCASDTTLMARGLVGRLLLHSVRIVHLRVVELKFKFVPGLMLWARDGLFGPVDGILGELDCTPDRAGPHRAIWTRRKSRPKTFVLF